MDRALLEVLAAPRRIAGEAARWHARNQQQIESALRSMRGVQLHAVEALGWVYEHREQIQAVLGALDQYSRRAEEIEAEWQRAGLGYLVSPLGIAEQLVLGRVRKFCGLCKGGCLCAAK
jgi:hypothetical protein